MDTLWMALTGAIVGAILGALVARSRYHAEIVELRRMAEERTREREACRAEAASLRAEVGILRDEKEAANVERSRLAGLLDAERAHAIERAEAAKAVRIEMEAQFRNLAQTVLEEKATAFRDKSAETLGVVLAPLQTELQAFRQKVEDVYINETKERSALGEQVRLLSELNGTLRNETISLTNALRGDSKAQGDWGELVLERLLESAGLIEGEHYRTQVVQEDAEGARVIPDVVLFLPNDRQLVVDSKVTLTAYTEYSSAASEEERETALGSHLEAVRRHIKNLSEMRYQDLYQLTGLDFVVMFMPLEGAFTAAVVKDNELFQFGLSRSVLLVSPSTFLFVVRTIAHVWRQEAQSKNAADIASRGAALYDKFAAFVSDLTKIGDQLEKAQDAYAAARKKLSDGSGNLVRQVEMLRKLGIKASKELPADLVASSEDSSDRSNSPLLAPGVTNDEAEPEKPAR